MNCKEKWGYTPEQILNFDCFVRDNKSETKLEMRLDAFQEQIEEQNKNKVQVDILSTIINEINLTLINDFNIDYRKIYKHIGKKYRELYIKERPKITADNIKWLQKPNKNRNIVTFCDEMYTSQYIKQDFNQMNIIRKD